MVEGGEAETLMVTLQVRNGPMEQVQMFKMSPDMIRISEVVVVILLLEADVVVEVEVDEHRTVNKPLDRVDLKEWTFHLRMHFLHWVEQFSVFQLTLASRGSSLFASKTCCCC